MNACIKESINEVSQGQRLGGCRTCKRSLALKSERTSTYYGILGKSFGLSELHFPNGKMKYTHSTLLSGLRIVSDDMKFGVNQLCTNWHYRL